MADIAEGLIGFMDEAVGYTLELVGEASTDYIKKEISEYYPPASDPRTPPHQRDGFLMAGVEWDAYPDESKVTIRSSRIGGMVPEWLEFGTKNMTERPYMTPAMLATDHICGDAIRYGMNPDAASAAAFHANRQQVAAATNPNRMTE